jgi:hypothetical protein
MPHEICMKIRANAAVLYVLQSLEVEACVHLRETTLLAFKTIALFSLEGLTVSPSANRLTGELVALPVPNRIAEDSDVLGYPFRPVPPGFGIIPTTTCSVNENSPSPSLGAPHLQAVQDCSGILKTA